MAYSAFSGQNNYGFRPDNDILFGGRTIPNIPTYGPRKMAFGTNSNYGYNGNNVSNNYAIPSISNNDIHDYGMNNMADFNADSGEEPNFANGVEGEDLGFGAIQQEEPFAFGDIGMDQLAAGAGIGKDLMSMYTGYQGLGLAKDQLDMQKKAYRDNKANRDRFIGNTQKAFA